MKTIYNLELHETMVVEGIMVIMRVASGWLYDIWDYTNDQYKQGIFVPFDNKFQDNPKTVTFEEMISKTGENG